MDRREVAIATNILEEVTRYIIATTGQFGMDWDYATFVSLKNTDSPQGELYIFYKNRPVKFKSSALVMTLHRLFEDYKLLLYPNVNSSKIVVKYILRNSDLKVDTKINFQDSNKWSHITAPDPSNPLDMLLEGSFS